ENRHFVDVQNIFHQMEQRTLKAAYQFYCSKQIVNAHSAEADTRATMEVLLAQIEKYQDTEFEDKKGKRSKPIVNDVAALHKFTNMNNPVDFAGRMVYSEQGEELFNFGKHKGRKVEEVFNAEPSYYSWMMQGDFPLYTKLKLEEIYSRWNTKRNAERQPKPAQVKPVESKEMPAIQKPVDAEIKTEQPKLVDNKPVYQKPAEAFPKKEFQKTEHRNNQYNKPFKTNDKPAEPVNEDMLKMLADKFKKG
ncbi:MAG: DNA polymerase III subunit epsilon, partial [Mucilaginibacter sp.]